MSVKNIAKNLDLFALIAELFVITLVAFFITFLASGFDFSKFNYKMFLLTEAFNIYCRCVATAYSSSKEKIMNEDVNMLGKSVYAKRRDYFASDKQKEFDAELYYYNCLKNYKKYYNELSEKKPKGEKKRKRLDAKMKSIDALIKLLEARNFEDFETLSKENGLFYIRNKYPKINVKLTHLWCGTSTTDKDNNDAFSFNKTTASVGYALPSMIGLALVNYMISCLVVGFTGTADTLIQLGSYLFSIIMGSTWGFKNGKRIIADDFKNVLTNNLKLIKELFKDVGIIAATTVEKD